MVILPADACTIAFVSLGVISSFGEAECRSTAESDQSSLLSEINQQSGKVSSILSAQDVSMHLAQPSLTKLTTPNMSTILNPVAHSSSVLFGAKWSFGNERRVNFSNRNLSTIFKKI